MTTLYSLSRLLGLAGLLVLAACTPAAPAPNSDPTPTPIPPAAGAPAAATTMPTTGPTGLTVFAASSLKDAFTAASLEFKAANPLISEVRFNFAGSQQLVAQLQQGAPGDVFASADKANMDKAVAAGVLDGAPRELARNVLVVALPHDNPGNIRGLTDLARAGVRLSLADPSVPVGAYTVQLLDNLAAAPAYGAGFKTGVLANVVSREDNVRQVLTRVQLGEVDAGIVYGTDVQAANAATGAAGQPVMVLVIPTQYNVTGVYYIAAVKGTPHAAAAQAWINYLLADAGQTILTRYGFIHSEEP